MSIALRLKEKRDRNYRAILRSRKSRIIMAAVAATLLCYTALASAFWHQGRQDQAIAEALATPEPSTAAGAGATKPAVQSNGPAQQIPGFPIALRRFGFEPAEIKRPQGRFHLTIINYSGLDNISLRLDRVGGGRLRAAQMSLGRLFQDEVLNLPPGSYVLSEENHPDWVCNITITP